MAFFRFESPATPEGRWYLASPYGPSGEEVDPRLFTLGERVDVPANLHIVKRRLGQPLDFTLADFDMPVVSAPLAKLLLNAAPSCVQLVPAKVEDEQNDYFILNIVQTVKCISEEQSLFTRWEANDGRPEKTGQFRMIVRPVLSTAHHTGQAIFRAAGWEIMLLAAPALAKVLLSSGLSGLELSLLPNSAGDA